MNLNEKPKELLIKMGFTPLESEIYLYLLVEGKCTGYAVAKGVGKAVANVYKAIESLAHKGAIEQSSGKNKQCIAVPWQQFILSETKKFNTNMEALTQSLQQLPSKNDDDEVYQIKNGDQVKEQALHMLNEAEHIVFANIEPPAMNWLKDSLIETAARGVEVRIKVYEAIDLPGVHVVVRKNASQIYDANKCVRLGLCTDGTNMLNALFTPNGQDIIQAFRSKSTLMTLMQYNELLYELVLTELKDVIPNGDLASAQQILKDSEHLHVFSAKNKVFDNFNQWYDMKTDDRK